MPVRSIVTSPANGTKLAAGTRQIALRGAAWAGDYTVRAVDLSDRLRQQLAERQPGPAQERLRLAALDGDRQAAERRLLRDLGARDRLARVMQPHIAGNWNPQGYGGNPMHRIAVLVG